LYRILADSQKEHKDGMKTMNVAVWNIEYFWPKNNPNLRYTTQTVLLDGMNTILELPICRAA